MQVLQTLSVMLASALLLGIGYYYYCMIVSTYDVDYWLAISTHVDIGVILLSEDVSRLMTIWYMRISVQRQHLVYVVGTVLNTSGVRSVYLSSVSKLLLIKPLFSVTRCVQRQ